ncbi:MAG TPA: hypothetical protein VFP43_11925 [Mesorhizobium sp.]|nr:hypothetical protein [Mesorhizobium sp.]
MFYSARYEACASASRSRPAITGSRLEQAFGIRVATANIAADFDSQADETIFLFDEVIRKHTGARFVKSGREL